MGIRLVSLVTKPASSDCVLFVLLGPNIASGANVIESFTEQVGVIELFM